MHRKAKELLFYPDAFFTKKAGEGTCLVVPAVIILIGGVVGLLTPSLIALISPGPINNFQIVPETIILSLGLPIIIWILMSGLLFILCRLFSGTGTFCATLQNTGYGALPLTIMSLVGILNGILIARFSEIPRTLATTAVLGLGFFSILCILWSGYIWAHAMEKTHDIPRKHAIEAAFTLVLLYLGVILITILI